MTISSLEPQQRPKVLIVDDEPVNIRVMHAVLKEKHQVFMATGGRQALELCARERPDLILLDIEMPGMDGFETCRLLQQGAATKEVPIIFVTGHISEEVETRALDQGAVDFVHKPISPAIMRARVRTQLQLKRQSDQLRELAFVDSLTGVGNRRSLNRQLDLEWKACRREQVPLGVVLIDVDHFKLYNDHYGHLEGDRALSLVASVLQGSLRRPRDFLARYGGEEFACILSGSDLESTHRCAEYLRSRVEEAQLPHAASPTASHITTSLGAAAWIPRMDADDPTELTSEADRRLYAAKQQGRNRVGSGLDPAT